MILVMTLWRHSGWFNIGLHLTVMIRLFSSSNLLMEWYLELILITLWHHILSTSQYLCIAFVCFHYNDVIMGAMAYQITGVSIVYSAVCPGADQIKHQSSASLTFVSGIHRWPVNSPHRGSVTPKMFPFHDVIMLCLGVAPTNFTHILKGASPAFVLGHCCWSDSDN